MSENELLVATLLGYGIVFVIGIFITRAIFSIPKFLRIKEAELKILSEIAIKNGVEPDKISGIINQAEL